MNQVMERTTHNVKPMHQTSLDQYSRQTPQTGAAQSDTVAQSNGAQVIQNSEGINDCDEENTGDNFAVCIMK